MSIGFEFSAGDFIAFITLIRDLRNSLEDSVEASIEYRKLITKLSTLTAALQQVQELDESSQFPQHEVVKQAALQCRDIVDGFLQKIVKFQLNLRAEGSSSR